ncbi:MAG: hypothetical protein Q9209_004624 [Squamulea sp. 1 TL-2023]
MNEAPQSASRTSTFSLPTTPSARTRSRSPTKKTSSIGDSSSFLTALAAQERRVLELREELLKAEDDLSQLKKQWATHEAIKKRNEFRHRQQLQKLEPASRSSYEECQTRSDGPAAFDACERLSAEIEQGETKEHADGERKASCPKTTVQIQRRFFEGSRHTRALSLLSKIGTSTHTSNLVLQRPSSQVPHYSQTSTPLKRGLTLSPRRPPFRAATQDRSTGQSREVFIVTGKQLVGDLREGLWTFFKDLRQATVGEEASSDPNRTMKAPLKVNNNPRSPGGRQAEDDYTLKSPSEGRPGSGGTSSEKPATSTPPQQQPTSQLAPRESRDARPNDGPSGLAKQIVGSDDEDLWDSWDSPMAKPSASCSLAESVTSDSVASSTTRRESPRSSLSSFDAAFTTPQTSTSIEKPKDIPWPALTNLSRNNLKMTASTLMNEWEKTIAQSTTLNPRAATIPTKLQKAD